MTHAVCYDDLGRGRLEFCWMIVTGNQCQQKWLLKKATIATVLVEPWWLGVLECKVYLYAVRLSLHTLLSRPHTGLGDSYQVCGCTHGH